MKVQNMFSIGSCFYPQTLLLFLSLLSYSPIAQCSQSEFGPQLPLTLPLPKSDHEPTPTLRNATPADATSIASVVAAAFSSVPEWDYLYPFRHEFPEEHIRCGALGVARFLKQKESWGEVVVVGGEEDGERQGDGDGESDRGNGRGREEEGEGDKKVVAIGLWTRLKTQNTSTSNSDSDSDEQEQDSTSQLSFPHLLSLASTSHPI
jgi:hypothetical protein